MWAAAAWAAARLGQAPVEQLKARSAWLPGVASLTEILDPAEGRAGSFEAERDLVRQSLARGLVASQSVFSTRRPLMYLCRTLEMRV